MAELQSGEVAVNAVVISNIPTTLPSTCTNNNIIVDDNNNIGPNLAPKRHRRPSVRLGEIGGGDQPPPPTTTSLPYDSSFPRRPKSWRFHRDPTALAAAKSSSKIRPLTNLVNGHAADGPEFEDNTNNFGSRKPKLRKSVKRVRTNWSRIENGIEMDSNNNTVSNKEEDEEEFRVLETDASDSPLRDQSPVQSVDNVAELNFWNRSRPTHKAESNRYYSGLDDGVRDWLIGLGLSRYGPLFEIHEVDDQVLPMLTLQDLKDMGINAVGSRRKMFASIVKLSKGFSEQQSVINTCKDGSSVFIVGAVWRKKYDANSMHNPNRYVVGGICQGILIETVSLSK